MLPRSTSRCNVLRSQHIAVPHFNKNPCHLASSPLAPGTKTTSALQLVSTSSLEMGVAASREFATEIANNADRGVGLESVLENPKVTNCNVFLVTRSLTIRSLTQWKLAYKRLSLKLRRSIQKITSIPQEDCLSRIRQVQKSDIGIPEKLRPYFESWKHPRRFFDHTFSIFKVEDTVSQVYVELRHIVDRSVDDPIRARIYVVALYDLRLLLDRNEPRNLRPAESRNLRPEVKAKIVQVLFDSPLVHDPLKDISK